MTVKVIGMTRGFTDSVSRAEAESACCVGNVSVSAVKADAWLTPSPIITDNTAMRISLFFLFHRDIVPAKLRILPHSSMTTMLLTRRHVVHLNTIFGCCDRTLRCFRWLLLGKSLVETGSIPHGIWEKRASKLPCDSSQKTLRLQPKDLAAPGKRSCAYSQKVLWLQSK